MAEDTLLLALQYLDHTHTICMALCVCGPRILAVKGNSALFRWMRRLSSSFPNFVLGTVERMVLRQDLENTV